MIVGNKKAQKRKRGVILTGYFLEELQLFTLWLERLGYASATVKGHYNRITHFFEYLKSNNIKIRQQITATHINTYQHILLQQTIKASSIVNQFNTLTRYCNYLEKVHQQKILYKELTIEKELVTQKNIITKTQIKQLFTSLENSPKGLLYRSFLHLYYSCGLRASEGAKVLPKHIDYNKRLLYIAPGKNYRSRYVPFSTKVAEQLKEYEQYGRPFINTESPTFLVNYWTNNMSTQITGRMWQRIRVKASLQHHITLHGLRHSIATHLVQGGMPLESVQQFLGHNTLDATQIYVRMSHEMIYNETL